MRTTPVFRYVAMDLTDNYALELEMNKLLRVGQKIYQFDNTDRKTHEYRILRIEGTVYNKSTEEFKKEKEVA